MLRQNLQKAAETLHLAMPDCDAFEQQIEEKATKLHDILGQTPVAIDFTATPRPLGLARFLLTHGFNVYAVYLDAVSPDEKDSFFFLKEHYPSTFFFDSKALLESNYFCIELTHVYRQSDTNFINLLNNIRENRFDDKTLQRLNQRYIPQLQTGRTIGLYHTHDT